MKHLAIILIVSTIIGCSRESLSDCKNDIPEKTFSTVTLTLTSFGEIQSSTIIQLHQSFKKAYVPNEGDYAITSPYRNGLFSIVDGQMLHINRLPLPCQDTVKAELYIHKPEVEHYELRFAFKGVDESKFRVYVLNGDSRLAAISDESVFIITDIKGKLMLYFIPVK